MKKILKRADEKIKLGMLQINNSFSGQNYLPYSAGLLQAYAQKYLDNISDFEFLLPVYKRIPVDSAVEKMREADIVFFSIYVWNRRISLEIAKKIKSGKPDVIIVFGGPHVPDSIETFLEENSFVDIVCHGEGEKPFLSILEHCTTGEWNKIPSISYINEAGDIVRNPRCERIKDLSTIPSPYLEGTFEPLMKAYPDEQWIVLWETNRGCPFSCAYCDWGSATQSRVYTYDMDRIHAEVDWFSANKIEFIYCCDANFGIQKRDIDIVNYVAKNKKKHGCPKSLSVQNTKNSTSHSYTIQKIMGDAGLNKGVTLSLQSLNKKTLESVGRQNISIESFQELQHRFTADGVETYTDLILGLPEETYETFKDGVSYVIENGQHNRIQFNNLSLLPNSLMGDPGYQGKYGFEIRETGIINIHGSLADTEEIFETQQLVVGTSTMPKEEWVKARVFGWMTSLLHFDKVLQIPLIMLHTLCSVRFRDLIELFTENVSSPVLTEIRQFFTDKAIDIQNGGAEYCESEKWLNIWWPADELVLIKLCAENRLENFYTEAEQLLSDFISKRYLWIPRQMLNETVFINRNLLKLPFQGDDLRIMLSYNILEIYKAVLRGDKLPLKNGDYECVIDRHSSTWSTWGDWCREVIWYGNKKGAYLYSYEQSNRGKNICRSFK